MKSLMKKSPPCALCAILAVSAVTFAAAQDPAPRAPAPQVYQPHPISQAIYWLATEQVQKELEVVPEQKEKLDKVRKEMQDKFNEAAKSFDFRAQKPEDLGKYYGALNAVSEETVKKVEDILLPHQIKRIKQIMTQQRLRTLGYGWGASVLAADDIAKQLGITDEQREELKKKELEVRQDIQRKTQEFQKKLQEEAREKLLGVLTPAQRTALQDLEGERFEWNMSAWQGGAGGVRPVEKKTGP